VGGPWILHDVEPGQYIVSVVRQDGVEWRRRVTLEPERSQWEVALDVSQSNARLSGRASGDAKRVFALWREPLDLVGTIWPGPDGAYNIENLPAGRYFAGDISCLTYRLPPSIEFVLGEGESKVLDLNLSGSSDKTAVLTVHVADELGRTPEGARVWLEGSTGVIEPTYGIETGPCFVVPPGGYTVHVEAPGFGPAERKITARPFDAQAARPQRIVVCLARR
jgi:hypothetical protein